MGGHLSTLLRADPLGPLGREVSAEPPEERGEDQAERDDHDDRSQRGVANSAEDMVGREEEKRGADDQQHAECAAVLLRQLRPRAARRCLRAGLRRLALGRRPVVPAGRRGEASRTQRRATPNAASASGQATASLHQMPSCRKASSAESVSSPAPTATRQSPRTRGTRPNRAIGAEPPSAAGSAAQAIR